MGPDRNKAMEMYKTMFTIRTFEGRESQVYYEGLQDGFVHLYIGEEAIAAGVCAALNSDDFITSTHRGHGHIIAKGGDLKKIMAELFGRKTGYCQGKGGSMHIAAFELGILGANGMVAGGIPIATGAACPQFCASRNRSPSASSGMAQSTKEPFTPHSTWHQPGNYPSSTSARTTDMASRRLSQE